MGNPSQEYQKVVCETPTPGKNPTRIARWKYDAVRQAILIILKEKKAGVNFSDLAGLVAGLLPQDVLARLGSVSWYTTTVKLDLEAKGEIVRVPGAKPQRLVLSMD